MTLWHKTLAHGVHPPENKSATAGSPIRQFPFAPLLVVPLAQHLGKPAIPRVREGQDVVRGQRIADPDGAVSAALHAPASGRIRSIALAPTLSGGMAPAVFLEPFPASTQEVCEERPCDLETASPGEILEAVQSAGVVGLGGAAFPTHVKLTVPDGKAIDAVVVNGAECEPYLTTDHRVMLEQTHDLLVGIRAVLRATCASRAIVGIEDNKPDAADAVRAVVASDPRIGVEQLRVKYPQGAEKLLIRALLGREVPSGGLPLDVGAVCVNVATTAEMGRLLPHGRGVQERVITVTGPAVKDPGNYRIPIGTPLRFVLETVGVSDDLQRVFLGGPMMGVAAPSLDVPIVKGTSGVVAFGAADASPTRDAHEYPCIRCARCIDACPLSLEPAELFSRARVGRYDEMASELHLMDCFECGCCSYVCPSHIPLVHHFRVAKDALRRAQRRATPEAR